MQYIHLQLYCKLNIVSSGHVDFVKTSTSTVFEDNRKIVRAIVDDILNARPNCYSIKVLCDVHCHYGQHVSY